MEMNSGKHVRLARFNALFVMGRDTRGRDTVPVDGDGRIVPADTQRMLFSSYGLVVNATVSAKSLNVSIPQANPSGIRNR